MDHLGTVLSIWAHPDDETYLVGGLSAAVADAGRRVVCVTATRGEAGGDGQVRTAELVGALEVLGVDEHHWLDYPDGGCADVDVREAATRIRAIVDEVSPDTVITFGPDGFTGHPDHQAVSAWTDRALEGYDALLLHAVARKVWWTRDWTRSSACTSWAGHGSAQTTSLALLLELEGTVLDRKVTALLRQESQTGALVDAVGLDRFRAWVASEAFAGPQNP